MPLYEYRCNECRRRTTKLVRSLSEPFSPSCDHCPSTNLTRLISRFTVQRSWGSSLDWAPGSEGFGSADPDNPKEMANYLRRMKREMGEEVTLEFDDMVDELESEAYNEEYGDGGESDGDGV